MNQFLLDIWTKSDLLLHLMNLKTMPFFIQTCASYTNGHGSFRKINGDGGSTIWTSLKS